MPRVNPVTPEQRARLREKELTQNIKRKKQRKNQDEFEKYWLKHDWGISKLLETT